MAQFKLSASLTGHEQDVRAVTSPNASIVLSASRDGTVRSFVRKAENGPFEAREVYTVHQGFVNSLAYIPRSEKHPQGLIVSGGQDKLIAVTEPGHTHDSNYVLFGHTENVCTLDVLPSSTVVSGSWDSTAKVWKNWECQYTLTGHEATVWAVLAVSENEVLTGSADKTIRFWRDGKQVAVFTGHEDVVRGLCRVPGVGFASCSNDGSVRVWSEDGHLLQTMYGHTSFVYAVAALPTGEIVSCGEDRSLRVWKDGECVQTIIHPAISVWDVAVAPNGDVVTGASDGVVRVFTRDPARVADEATLKQYHETIAAQAIPSNQVGDVQKDKLPGPEALTQPGTKEGQVLMVRVGAMVEAHQWSSGQSQWLKIGEVVDAVGSSRKQIYEGKEYDYVFDVDVQEGVPPLKLPYNARENPWDAASRFIERNGLQQEFTQQVVDFIIQNSRGVEIPAPGGGADPYNASRYVPQGGVSSAPAPTTFQDPYHSRTTRTSSPKIPKVLPQKLYLSTTQANLSALRKKVLDVNAELLKSGEKGISLNPEEIADLEAVITFLESHTLGEGGSVVKNGLAVAVKIGTRWPGNLRFPGVDLLRLLVAATPTASSSSFQGKDIVQILLEAGQLDGSPITGKEKETNGTLAIRGLGNLFNAEQGRKLAVQHFEDIYDAARAGSEVKANRNLKVASATVFLNYAVLFHGEKEGDHSLGLLEQLAKIISSEADSETLFRALVALGTLTHISPDIAEAAAVFDAKTAVQGAAERVKEPRIKQITEEIISSLP
ncbi:WD repeat protein Lub1 [Saitoella coloradoensis]